MLVTYQCLNCHWQYEPINGEPDRGPVIARDCPSCGGRHADRPLRGADLERYLPSHEPAECPFPRSRLYEAIAKGLAAAKEVQVQQALETLQPETYRVEDESKLIPISKDLCGWVPEGDADLSERMNSFGPGQVAVAPGQTGWAGISLVFSHEEVEGLDRQGFKDLLRARMQRLGDEMMAKWEEKNGG